MVSDRRQDNFLTLGEIAEALKVSAETVRRLVVAGELPAIDVTPNAKKRCYRIRRDHYEQFIAKRWVTPVVSRGKTLRGPRVKNYIGL